jgi:hypothetical protein
LQFLLQADFLSHLDFSEGFLTFSTFVITFFNHFSCLYALADGENDFIVLEDLSPTGYVTADRTNGLDLDHCIAALQTLGRFHALSFAMKDQDPEGFETIANSVKVCDLEELNEECVSELTQFFHYILFSVMSLVLFNSVTFNDCHCH